MPIARSNTIQENPTLSQSDVNAGFELRKYDDGRKPLLYAMSDAVNKRLRESDIALDVSNEPYEVLDKHKEYAHIFLDYQLGVYDKEKFDNRDICGLMSDLSPEMESVKIAKAEYFDTLATFQAFPFVYRNDDGNIEFKGSSFIYNDFGVIYPISARRCANPVGASTIVLSADEKILVTRQPEGSFMNADRYMPSGSGVTKWEAIENEELSTLQELIAVAAEHKAMEECGLPGATELETRVVGAARVPTGMRPDFFCVSETASPSAELGGSGNALFELVDFSGRRPSEALREFIARKNSDNASAVSLQLFLEAELLAEIGM